MNYGFIGFGNLAKAIHKGLKNNKNLNFAYTSKNNKCKEVCNFNNIKDLVDFADIIFVCVKPQALEEVLQELKLLDLSKKTIVSTIAGKKISIFKKYLNCKNYIRIMPNLAISYGLSVTAFFSESENKKSKYLKNNLENLGVVLEISEDKFDDFTAIFGSGPAFLLKIFSVFNKKIKEISNKNSNELLLSLVQGTVKYLESDQDTEKLINKIACKGGTTEAGLKTFENENITNKIYSVIETAKNKSKDISKD